MKTRKHTSPKILLSPEAWASEWHGAIAVQACRTFGFRSQSLIGESLSDSKSFPSAPERIKMLCKSWHSKRYRRQSKANDRNSWWARVLESWRADYSWESLSQLLACIFAPKPKHDVLGFYSYGNLSLVPDEHDSFMAVVSGGAFDQCHLVVVLHMAIPDWDKEIMSRLVEPEAASNRAFTPLCRNYVEMTDLPEDLRRAWMSFRGSEFRCASAPVYCHVLAAEQLMTPLDFRSVFRRLTKE